MITVDVERRGIVAVDGDDEGARYTGAGRLTRSRPAGDTEGLPVRMLVEVLRRFGGHAPVPSWVGSSFPARA